MDNVANSQISSTKEYAAITYENNVDTTHETYSVLAPGNPHDTAGLGDDHVDNVAEEISGLGYDPVDNVSEELSCLGNDPVDNFSREIKQHIIA